MTILGAKAKLDRVLTDVAVFHAEGKPPLDTAQLVKDLAEVKNTLSRIENQLLTLTSISARLIDPDVKALKEQQGRIRSWNEAI